MKPAFDLFLKSRVRLVRQTEIAECGLACLTMVADYHGLRTDLGTMRRRFVPSLRGTALKSLMGLADQIGLTPRAVKVPLGQLKNLHLPAILHWDMNHYVVLERVRRSKALIHNPDGRSSWLPIEEVSDHFTGVALELRPNDSFVVTQKQDRLKLSQLWQRMTGMKRALSQVIVLSLVLQSFVLVSPYYMQLALDQALPAFDHDLLTVLALGFSLFSIINVIATFLRSYVLLVAGSSLGMTLASNIARRLLRLPIEWFQRRHTGDILSRFQSIIPIQSMLTQGAVAGVVDGIMAVFTLALMIFYSPALTAVTIISFSAYALVRIVSFSLEKNARESSIIAHGREQSNLIESLRGITTLRLFGQEMSRHHIWQNRLIDAVNSDVVTSRISIFQLSSNILIFGLENVISIWLAVGMVMNGDGFSIGMVFAYMSYKTQFIEKASSLIDQSIALCMTGLHLERISDIALSMEDVGFNDTKDSSCDLNGSIDLQNIFYRYSPSDPFILSGLDLKINSGEHVAITGMSGGGKSTLVKLLIGFLEPERGVMLVDGLPLGQFGRRNFQRQIAAVLQDDTLFAGTLADNIALFDDHIDMDSVVAAAMTAAIHDDITRMPMSYQTLVGDMGSTLSGGQKQRIFLARALYRKPRILVMDEGTAHLDVLHERAVNEAVGNMGITRIVIAHRRETIEAADRILVLSRGKLSEVARSEG